MKRTMTRLLTLAVLCAMVLTLFGCGGKPVETTQPTPTVDLSQLDFTVNMKGIKVGNVSSLASVHDPSILCYDRKNPPSKGRSL